MAEQWFIENDLDVPVPDKATTDYSRVAKEHRVDSDSDTGGEEGERKVRFAEELVDNKVVLQKD